MNARADPLITMLCARAASPSASARTNARRAPPAVSWSVTTIPSWMLGHASRKASMFSFTGSRPLRRSAGPAAEFGGGQVRIGQFLRGESERSDDGQVLVLVGGDLGQLGVVRVAQLGVFLAEDRAAGTDLGYPVDLGDERAGHFHRGLRVVLRQP